MNDENNIDVSEVTFTSKVFPTDADMEAWETLSDAERIAVIERDEEAGFRSGIAEPESLEDRLARVRATLVHAL